MPPTEPPSAPSRSLVRDLAPGALLALGIGAIEVALALLWRDSDWGAPELARVLAASTAAVLLVASAWRLALVEPLARRGLERPPLLGALAFGAVGLHLGLCAVALADGNATRRELALALVSGAVGALAGALLGRTRARRGLRGGAELVPAALALEVALLAPAVGLGHERPPLEHVLVAAGALAVALGVLVRLPGARTRAAGSPLWPLACLLACAAPFAFPSGPSRGPARAAAPPAGAPRDVILLVVDTLRADQLSCLAADAPPTPAFDALAADSLVFADARASASWTLPSMCSMLTGTSPLVHRADDLGRVLPAEVPTLAERLAAAGYRTGAFGENVLLLPPSGLARGFDEYELRPRLPGAAPLAGALLRFVDPHFLRADLPAPLIHERALAWLDAGEGAPAFLWLHYFDVHQPYAPAPEFHPRGARPMGLGYRFDRFREVRSGHYVPDEAHEDWIRALYRAEIRQLDAELGRFLAALRARGRYDDALIVLTSDHGEELWDHGGYEHGHTVHDELLRVPLFVKLPGARAAQVLRGPVSTEAIVPTVLALCGLDAASPELSSAPLVGADGAPRAPGAGDVVLATGCLYFEDRLALVAADAKLERALLSGRETLYDLAADPGERAPLPAEGARADELRRALQELRARARAAGEALGVGAPSSARMSRETERMLEELGYHR